MTDESPTPAQNKLLYLFTGLAVLINFSGLFIPIQGVDATIYALISKTMVQRNDFVQLIYHGADWLDKPHFPFWITALSFKLFGFTTWAYKLPGILFLMMGAYYTWLLAKELYNKQIALWSVLILLTAQHIVLSNNDVRAEPYLTGLIIAAVYHFYKAHTNNSFWQLLTGCIFTACAIMTKGMFALVPIGGAIAGQFIFTRQWRSLFNLRWLIAAVLIFIFILPELWCLNQQFDLHPEKVIFGQKGVSGIRFFFWDSQFGRFFNTGPIKGHGDLLFFVHTALWAFLPWSLIMFVAVFQFIKKGFKYAQAKEWYCISGALLTFLLFSASGFQLPHYLNIVFPFFAIITAQYLNYLSGKKSILAIAITQNVVISLMLLLIAALHYFFRPQVFSWFTALTLLMLLIMLLFFSRFIRIHGYQKIALRTLLVSFIVNLYLNLSFYPSLMHYQTSSEASIWINDHNPRNLPVAAVIDDNSTPFEFYSNKPVFAFNADGKLSHPAPPFLLYTEAEAVKGLNAKGLHTQTLATFQRYWVTRIGLPFLNKKTREKELTAMVVVEVE
ncbi:ArnT family glycosyltransferase [Mucilaginibacter sp. OK098]|uniref:ArnT family glycosyltransferase n=1 Tax=Mucilaginibacter sp. OK098 TaxID=1855297 RepID=UPI00091CEB62|nr:glycosyltransferase family 39 protein [Mucilaginibacter sp. OK098]SHN34261.1 4-amino-4-deoxy-L-arabinose transferase [Mucilaginibacter sp. OK098]